MRRMRNLIIVAGLVLALNACSKSKTDQALSESEGFKDRMCACKDGDKDCGEKVRTEYREWRKGMREKMSKDEANKMSDETKQKAKETAMAMMECEARVMGEAGMGMHGMHGGTMNGGSAPAPTGSDGSAAAPTPPPPAPTPAPAGSAAPTP
jgi:hypothetical protein